ncbi:hypothetical protein CTAYLR_008496 [Chrysophaeum taylorii]|uniref:Uncharacterized protein n=1 Tax=Chrysophaeum taylorii TaxID=2483200 RepID=A0AAD7UAE2_9STRA|nr:hypothetical protein CTAYLR_008496 [Chrysophaeum taylorii]
MANNNSGGGRKNARQRCSIRRSLEKTRPHTVLAELGFVLALAEADEDEDCVVLAVGDRWQLGLSGDEVPCAAFDVSNFAEGRTAFRDFFQKELSCKRCPPYLVVAVSAAWLEAMGASAEMGARQFAAFGRDDVGFARVGVIDSRHALLYERQVLTCVAVHCERYWASFAAIWDGRVVGRGVAKTPDKLGEALRGCVAGCPIDTRHALLTQIYVAGAVPQWFGKDREEAAADVRAVLPNASKVMIPAQFKYASWMGASKMGALSGTIDALRNGVATTFFVGDSSGSYWSSLLRGRSSSSSKDDDDDDEKVEPLLSFSARDVEAARAELLSLAASKERGPAPAASFLARPAQTGPLWLWGDHRVVATTAASPKAEAKEDDKEKVVVVAEKPKPKTPIKVGVESVGSSVPIGDDKLSAALEGAGEDAYGAICDCKEGHLFSCAQILRATLSTPSVRTRLAIVETLGQRCSDPDKGKPLVDVFAYDKERRAVEAVLSARAKALRKAKTHSGSSKAAVLRGGGRGGRGRGRSAQKKTTTQKPRPPKETPPAPPPKPPKKQQQQQQQQHKSPVRETKHAPRRQSCIVRSPLVETGTRVFVPQPKPRQKFTTTTTTTTTTSRVATKDLSSSEPVDDDAGRGKPRRAMSHRRASSPMKDVSAEPPPAQRRSVSLLEYCESYYVPMMPTRYEEAINKRDVSAVVASTRETDSSVQTFWSESPEESDGGESYVELIYEPAEPPGLYELPQSIIHDVILRALDTETLFACGSACRDLAFGARRAVRLRTGTLCRRLERCGSRRVRHFFHRVAEPKPSRRLVVLERLYGIHASLPSAWHAKALKAHVSAREFALHLSFADLDGPLPPTIARLGPHLAVLGLSHARLSGSLPLELGRLRRLVELDVSCNKLSGQIPTEITKLTSLTYLSLHDNRFEGAIPFEFGNLRALRHLHLWSNRLTGSIPTSLGNLPDLQTLWLHENFLRGPIPVTLASCHKLEWLSLRDNDLDGALPAAIATLVSLKFLYLQRNHLTGRIPPEIGDLPFLQEVRLQENFFEGPVPRRVAKLLRVDIHRSRYNTGGRTSSFTSSTSRWTAGRAETSLFHRWIVLHTRESRSSSSRRRVGLH